MEPDLVKVKPSLSSKHTGDSDCQANLEELDTKDGEDILSIKPMGPLNIQDTPNYGLFTSSSLLLDTSQRQQQDLHHRHHRNPNPHQHQHQHHHHHHSHNHRHHHHNHHRLQNNSEKACFANNLELDQSDQNLESKHTLQSIDQHISPQRDETCLKVASKSHHKSLKGSSKNNQNSIKPWMEQMEMIERKPGQLDDSSEDDSSSLSSRSCDSSPSSSSTSSSGCSFPEDKCNSLLNKQSYKYHLNQNRVNDITSSCSSSIMQPSSRKVSKGSSSLQIKQYTLSTSSPSAKSYFYRNQPNSYDLSSAYTDQYKQPNKTQKFKPIYSSSLSDTEYHQRQFASSSYHKNIISSQQFALANYNKAGTTLLAGYETEKRKGHRVLETNTLTRFENKKRISNQPVFGTVKSFYWKNYDASESRVKSGAANLELDYQKSAVDKERECYTSALSLVSNSTTFSNRVENRHSLEIRNLKRDLDAANEKVAYLTSQLNTNSHMVAAFEQSLSSMTSRLQHLTNLSQVKDYELAQLKSTIDELSHNNSSGAANFDTCIQKGDKKSSLVRRHTLTSQPTSKDSKSGLKASFTSQVSASIRRFKEKKRSSKGTESMDTESDSELSLSKGWIRSSLSKAFRKAKAGVKYHGSVSEHYHQNIRGRLNGLKASSLSVPNSPIMPTKLSSCDKSEDHMEGRMVEHLKQKLSEKEKELVDLRLEALTAAHQLDNFKEVVNKLQSEMVTLKKDNQRLERIIVDKSLHTSKSCSTASSSSLVTSQPVQKKIIIYIASFKISTISVSSSTSWQLIEQLIKKCIKHFLHRIDPDHHLGLQLDHFDSYQIGKSKTTHSLVTEADLRPQLLPFSYLLDKPKVSVRISSDLNSLAFETLICKPVLEKIIDLLKEKKRLIIYGPSGTGKSYLAQKLAQYLVRATNPENKLHHQADPTCESIQNTIVSINMGNKAGNELECISKHFAPQANALPVVIILDNLYHISSLEEVFKNDPFVNKDDNQSVYIIATLRQTSLPTEGFELKQRFNWLMYTNHEEPVKGHLARYLKMKLIKTETEEAFKREVVDSSNADMIKIMDWLVSLWNYVNNFLENNHSTEVTLGPEIFTSCPTKIEAFEKWLSHLWNQSLCPYLTQAAKEGVETTGLRLHIEDPTEWILKTYPLPNSQGLVLKHINLEDIKPSADDSLNSPLCDKLSEMLIKLKKSANIDDAKEVQSHKSTR